MEKQSFFRVQKKNVEEEKYVICIKDELASKEEFNTREEAEQYIESKPWVLNFCAFVKNNKTSIWIYIFNKIRI